MKGRELGYVHQNEVEKKFYWKDMESGLKSDLYEKVLKNYVYERK